LVHGVREGEATRVNHLNAPPFTRVSFEGEKETGSLDQKSREVVMKGGDMDRGGQKINTRNETEQKKKLHKVKDLQVEEERREKKSEKKPQNA